MMIEFLNTSEGLIFAPELSELLVEEIKASMVGIKEAYSKKLENIPATPISNSFYILA